MENHGQLAAPRIVGRYALHGAIASGGMATVHFGRLLGPVGFSRTVAIKRLHAQYAADPEFVSMFLDEARLAARVQHPNVVPTLDVVAVSGELFLVMEYVPGESLSRLFRALRDRGHRIPLRITSSIIAGVLHGLHAAHEAKTERGDPLWIVHRDVSPQNVLVGTDGAARVLDFGVAKAAGRSQQTRDGQIKGKLAYMAPEQLRGAPVTRQSDIYAASVLLWELLTGERLFSADNEGALVTKVLEGDVATPSSVLPYRPGQTLSASEDKARAELDLITLRGLNQDMSLRFATAREMAIAIEKCVPPATGSEVGEWVEATAPDILLQRAGKVAEIESSTDALLIPSYGEIKISSSRQLTVPRDDGFSTEGRVRTPPPDPPSQMSSIAVAKPASYSVAPARRSSPIVVIGVILTSLTVAVVGSAVAWRVRTLRTQGVSPPTQQVAPEPAPPVPDGPSVGVARVPPVAASASAPQVSLPPPTGTAQAFAAASAPPAPITRPRPHPPTGKTPSPECSPPFTWDAEGRKHYKPNCI